MPRRELRIACEAVGERAAVFQQADAGAEDINRVAIVHEWLCPGKRLEPAMTIRDRLQSQLRSGRLFVHLSVITSFEVFHG